MIERIIANDAKLCLLNTPFLPKNIIIPKNIVNSALQRNSINKTSNLKNVSIFINILLNIYVYLLYQRKTRHRLHSFVYFQVGLWIRVLQPGYRLRAAAAVAGQAEVEEALASSCCEYLDCTAARNTCFQRAHR